MTHTPGRTFQNACALARHIIKGLPVFTLRDGEWVLTDGKHIAVMTFIAVVKMVRRKEVRAADQLSSSADKSTGGIC